MNILETKEKLNKRVVFNTCDSQFRELRAVASELNIPYGEVIRDSIRYALEQYYIIKDGEDS